MFGDQPFKPVQLPCVFERCVWAYVSYSSSCRTTKRQIITGAGAFINADISAPCRLAQCRNLPERLAPTREKDSKLRFVSSLTKDFDDGHGG